MLGALQPTGGGPDRIGACHGVKVAQSTAMKIEKGTRLSEWKRGRQRTGENPKALLGDSPFYFSRQDLFHFPLPETGKDHCTPITPLLPTGSEKINSTQNPPRSVTTKNFLFQQIRWRIDLF